ncbi:MAG: type III pantothenate kinase [Burkholderiales bacterium]
MILAIDCGNTRLKWGVHDGDVWRDSGSVPIANIARLGAAWKKMAAPEKIVVSNVAGDAARRRLDGVLSRWPVAPIRVTPKRRQCGVTNNYKEPARLGADRWAALIGARALVRGPCLVVTAGTATTADILKRNGTFAGGVIFPGFDLMKRSLARNTARLPLADGHFAAQPRSTADAIETGCLLAQAGAVERMFATLGPGAVCVLSGGAAARLAPHLRIAVRLVDNLVLEGLVRIAR